MYRIEDVLRQKGISKTEFAKLLGISKQAVTNVLNGNPTKARLEEMAQLLGVPTWQLFVDPEDIYNDCAPRYQFCAFIRLEDGQSFSTNSLSELRELLDKLEVRAKE